MPDNDNQNNTVPSVERHVCHAGGGGSLYIEKLEGVANYASWKFSMKMALILEGLWDCIIVNTNGENIDSAKDQKALARIALGLKPALFQHLHGCETAKTAWDKLERLFEDKGLYRRVVLLRQLHRVDLNSYSNMTTYVDAVMTLVRQLEDIGKLIEDEEIAEILLSGLPQEYDNLVSGLETASITNKLSIELVRTRLLQEEYRKNGTEVSDTAFVAKRMKNVTCHHCGKVGHIKSRCFKLKQQKKNHSKDKQEQTLLAASFMAMNADDFIVDSGCSSHMCNKSDYMRDFKNTKNVITVADKDSIIQSNGVGNIDVSINNVNKTLVDVMYVPQLSVNLLSVSRMTEKGMTVIFNRDGCSIYEKCNVIGKPVMSADLCKGVYKLNDIRVKMQSSALLHELQEAQTAKVAQSKSCVSAEVWHRRLGHLSFRGMCVLRDRAVHNVMFQTDKEGKLSKCIACLEGKPVARAYPQGGARRATCPLELIHSDVCGPMKDCSWSGARYLLTFTDDFTRKSFGYLLKQKSEVMSCFIKFKSLVEKQTGLKVKCLRSDNGGEYCSANFRQYLEREGIIHQTTVPYCAPQNGVAERLNRTVLEKSRCMLRQAGLCNRFWGEAVMTALYLKNRSPTAALAGQLPEEVWSGHSISLEHLRTFGCIAYSLLPEPTRTSKLDAKANMCIFVGYSETTKGYRLIEPSNPKRVILSRNVNFIEDKF